MGEQDRTAELREQFRTSLIQRLEALVGAWSSRSLDPAEAVKEVRRLAHKLRGSAAIYGFRDLSSAARDVVQASESGLPDALARLLALLDEATQGSGTAA